MIGKPKAAVLPVPVRARAIKLVSPVKRRGIASTWIGEGVTKPFFVTAFNVYSSSPKSSNVTVSGVSFSIFSSVNVESAV